MFIVNWVKETFSDILSWLGFLPENSKILFLGLDNAGKTTLLHLLKDDRITTHNPTLHPHAEELYIGNRRFRAFDLGGHEAARRIWRDYYAEVDAVIFLVDAADRTRMDEAREELQHLFETESLRNVPFAILGNKIDIPTACSDEEIRSYLEIPASYNYGGMGGGQVQAAYRPGGGPIEVFMVSLIMKTGYGPAFQWISNMLKQQKSQRQEN
jgi:GTP-binding protein SAR1